MGRLKIRQRRLTGIGEIYEAFITSLPFLSAIQFLTILTIFYNDVKEYLLPLVPWITFPAFIGGVTLALGCIMFLVYRFLIPSIWTFRGKQLYGFESELMEEIRGLKEEIKKMKEVK